MDVGPCLFTTLSHSYKSDVLARRMMLCSRRAQHHAVNTRTKARKDDHSSEIQQLYTFTLYEYCSQNASVILWNSKTTLNKKIRCRGARVDVESRAAHAVLMLGKSLEG